MIWTALLPLALAATPDFDKRDAPKPRAVAPAHLQPLSGPLYRQLSQPERRRSERPQLVLELADPAAAGALASIPGVEIELQIDDLVQLRAGWDTLETLAQLPGVTRVREPRRAHAKEVVSEGLDDLFAQDWSALGLTGAGVKIAIVDVGFDGYSSLLGSELPSSVETHLVGDWRGSEHGTNVAQIIHDIAPDAELALYSFDTDVEFLAAVYEIVGSDAHLVNASIGFDNQWHADGTSLWSQGVDLVHDAGIAWFNAAGNESDNYWVGTLTDDDNDGWLELDGDELFVVETDWTSNAEVDVSFRWDDPFGASSNDLDLYLDWIDYEDGDEPCASSEDPQDGDDDPYEYAWCNLHTDDLTAYASVYVYDGVGEGKTGWLYSYWELPEANRSYSQNLTLPGDAVGGIAVAAVDWEYDEIADYSSRGPTDDGRDKPDVAAPTLVSTTNGWFDGTSAATPHATGAAALALEASLLSMDPEELRDWLSQQVVDLGDPGYDYTYGWGYLRLDEPPEAGGGGDTGDTGLDTDGLSDAGGSDTDPAGDDTDVALDEGPPGKVSEPICACTTGATGSGAALMLATLAGLVLGRRRRRDVDVTL